MSLFHRHVVILLTGVSAAGKSTVGQKLAERFERAVHVRGDRFRRMVVSGREEMSDTPTPEAWRQLRLRYRLGANVADAYFDAGFSVIVQDVVLGPPLAEYVDLLRSRPLLVVVLAPRPDVVAAREAARSKTAYRDASAVAIMDAGFRRDTPRIGLWIDSSEQTPDQTVEEIGTRAWDEGRVTT